MEGSYIFIFDAECETRRLDQQFWTGGCVEQAEKPSVARS
jgi:hypothetical protein